MERSAELRGLLAEIAREHGINRALMRQELTFLSHLTRADRPGARARLSPAGRRAAAPRPARPTAPSTSRRNPELLMPISSFYGMQTSLRGLMAQQRMLDTTGHNIANASTVGYSRQEATLAASQALQIPAGSTGDGAGAHLGSGVDVQGFRRVRDQFLDLAVPRRRTRTCRSGRRAPTALDSAELSLAEPGDNGINAQLVEVLERVVGPLQGTRRPRRQAGARRSRRPRSTTRSTRVRSQMVAAQSAARAEYDDITRPASGPTRAARSPRSRPSWPT